MNIKAAIFDIDGTVLDTERIYMKSWKIAAEEKGFPMPYEALAGTRSVSGQEAEKIFKHYCGEAFDYKKTWVRRVELAEEMIASAGAENLVKPGVHETFAYLKEHGIKICAASMTTAARTYSHLESAGLINEFDCIFTGDDVKNGKPAPDIFIKAAEAVGVLPAECVVVEDSASGIRAGHASGAKVLMIPDAIPERPGDSDFYDAVLDTMEKAPEIIENWRSSSN